MEQGKRPLMTPLMPPPGPPSTYANKTAKTPDHHVINVVECTHEQGNIEEKVLNRVEPLYVPRKKARMN